MKRAILVGVVAFTLGAIFSPLLPRQQSSAKPQGLGDNDPQLMAFEAGQRAASEKERLALMCKRWKEVGQPTVSFLAREKKSADAVTALWAMHAMFCLDPTDDEMTRRFEVGVRY